MWGLSTLLVHLITGTEYNNVSIKCKDTFPLNLYTFMRCSTFQQVNCRGFCSTGSVCRSLCGTVGVLLTICNMEVKYYKLYKLLVLLFCCLYPLLASQPKEFHLKTRPHKISPINWLTERHKRIIKFSNKSSIMSAVHYLC